MQRQNSAAVLVAPFWGQDGHVGSYCVERFLRWFRSVNVDVTIVNTGSRDEEFTFPWGRLLVVRDPLHSAASSHAPASGVGRLRRARHILVNAISAPDGKRAWAYRVANDLRVLEAARSATWIVSTNPPESAHMAASALAKRTGARHIVDLRDGWLDDSLKWLLRHSRIQRWREGRLERAVLERAHRVFVVSDVLAEMLAARIPTVSERLVVLTNGAVAPESVLPPRPVRPLWTGERALGLLYAGRFTSSRSDQDPGALLQALIDGSDGTGFRLDVTLLGSQEPEVERAIHARRATFAALHWQVRVLPPTERSKALAAMVAADGLLLLAIGRTVLTTKFFEYLAAGRPILAVATRDGALWRVGTRLPQVFCADPTDRESTRAAVARFLEAAASDVGFPAPTEFSDTALRQTFLTELGLMTSEG
jgi:hypothetical protein